MAKDEKKTITVNDKQYNVEDLNDQQIAMVNHIQDLDRKLANARFNVDQLTVGREAFVDMLAKSLETEEAA
jgi:cell division protein ZapA (FtsZ GTPase activity inhibitor)